MKTEYGKNLALGAAAGAAGTLLIRGIMAGSQRFAPDMLPPISQDPGRYMVKQAERALPLNVRAKISPGVESAGSVLLAFGYGTAFGLLYGGARPRGGDVLLDGAALGTATWAAGYLGWLPATRLTPPVWKQTPKQVVPNFLSHVLFGIATVALFRWSRQKLT
jgi:hypothetical protein